MDLLIYLHYIEIATEWNRHKLSSTFLSDETSSLARCLLLVSTKIKLESFDCAIQNKSLDNIVPAFRKPTLSRSALVEYECTSHPSVCLPSAELSRPFS